MRSTRSSGGGIAFLVLAIVLRMLAEAVAASVRRTIAWAGVAMMLAVLVVAGTVVSAAARAR